MHELILSQWTEHTIAGLRSFNDSTSKKSSGSAEDGIIKT